MFDNCVQNLTPEIALGPANSDRWCCFFLWHPDFEPRRSPSRVILLMEEILQHLGCINPCKEWDKPPINWCRISCINSIFMCIYTHPKLNSSPLHNDGWKMILSFWDTAYFQGLCCNDFFLLSNTWGNFCYCRSLHSIWHCQHGFMRKLPHALHQLACIRFWCNWWEDLVAPWFSQLSHILNHTSTNHPVSLTLKET